MISCQKVSKSYHGVSVLADISLNFDAGKTHVIIGQSGCGKSTLVRLFAGLVQADDGLVSVDGRNAAEVPDRDKALLFGYMIQDGGLFPHLTALQNIQLPAKTHSRVGEQIDRWARELCDMVELDPARLSQYPRQLSGGQRQRVALIRSLILNPPLLFLDEPMGALDPLVRSSLQNSLRAVFQKLKKTVVFVTHDLTEAAYFADTVTLMKEGKIEQHGTFEELVNSPRTEFVTEYLAAQRPPPRLGGLK